ncbi:hypothetical protein PJL15_03350 [Paenarthrobacter nitroguajacolicus]|nr:hypothetical protein [Paenarthrobacter nitroguajacolicus]
MTMQSKRAARTRPSSWPSVKGLLEAAAAGTARMNVKMAEAVTLAKIAGTIEVDKALGNAAFRGASRTGIWPRS